MYVQVCYKVQQLLNCVPITAQLIILINNANLLNLCTQAQDTEILGGQA